MFEAVATPSTRNRGPSAPEPAATRPGLVSVLVPALGPALAAGVAGGIALFALGRLAPPALLRAQAALEIPLMARVLHGGVTEELLLRWGLMTALVWLGWRVLERRRRPPRPVLVWMAIALSALLFGVGHLPAASALTCGLQPTVIAYVVSANTLFGVVFGVLYWRWGLEAAILAHAIAHVVNAAVDAIAAVAT